MSSDEEDENEETDEENIFVELKDLKKLCENLSDVFIEGNSNDSDFKVKSNDL